MRIRLLAAICVVAAGVSALDVRAQDLALPERPIVENLVFEGVESVDTRDLRRSIFTQETRCRTVLLAPFCWLTDWSVFIERHRLNRQELERDELRLRVFYFRRGFREAQVRSEVRPYRGEAEVVFTVEEGSPTILESLELHQTEEVLGSRQIRRAPLPREGEPLDLFQLDSARVQLREFLEDEGYLDAEVRDTVEVDRTARIARVVVVLEPGRRTTVGEFDIEGNEEVDDATITRSSWLRPGRVIRRGDVDAAQRSLYESNLFHEVEVTIPEQPDSAKRVEIRVREAPQRGAEAGVGFNTVDFIQTEGRFVHYNWLGGGRRLDARVTLGNLLAGSLNDWAIFRDVAPREPIFEDADAFLRPTWQASVDFQQPGFWASENTLSAGLFANRRVVPGIAIDRGHGIRTSFTRRFRDRSPASVSYRFEITAVEAGELYFCVNFGICDPLTIAAVRANHRLSPFTASLIHEPGADPLLQRVFGWRTRFDLEHASRLTLSDFRYNRVSGAVVHYLPIGPAERRVLAGRVRFGWVGAIGNTAAALGLGDEIDGGLLHPRKRFYSGGSHSVRGFGENQLGPRVLTVDPDILVEHDQGCALATIEQCDPGDVPVDELVPRPLGGNQVLEGNVEYRFPVWRELHGAVFVDGAIVWGRGEELLGTRASAVTPGFGVRYQSPVGPIRVDLGVRPSITETLPVVSERFDEEGIRRIVILDQPRRYDPVEDTGGFLRQILERLTLHISIGQAF